MKCCDITPGSLRHRVTLQRAETSADGVGGEIETWRSYATVYSYVRPLSGFERFAADREENPVTKRIVMRFRRDIQNGDRVLYNGLTHRIVYIIDMEERRQWLELGVMEGVAT